jgi:dATP pyrophosphohydrolase
MSDRTTQVEVIVFKIINDKILFLLLKRNEQRGGFWQPVTGGVEEGENLIEAVNRELREETGITRYLRIIENLHYFEFKSEGYGELKEYVFGVEIDPATNIKLSSEHTEMKWCDLDEALTLLKHDSNKVGFRKISQLILNK